MCIRDRFTTTRRSWISRVAYASDTSTASPRGNMTVSRGGCSSTGNASYAWISGQYQWQPSSAGPYASTVDRIDFSNDNTTTSARTQNYDGAFTTTSCRIRNFVLNTSGDTTYDDSYLSISIIADH